MQFFFSNTFYSSRTVYKWNRMSECNQWLEFVASGCCTNISCYEAIRKCWLNIFVWICNITYFLSVLYVNSKPLDTLYPQTPSPQTHWNKKTSFFFFFFRLLFNFVSFFIISTRVSSTLTAFHRVTLSHFEGWLSLWCVTKPRRVFPQSHTRTRMDRCANHVLPVPALVYLLTYVDVCKEY